jgi:2-keto-4-pentenoate hydratase/2-oxohepta-3-ene-1,7-dioic acid hydratase in catechol pathway
MKFCNLIEDRALVPAILDERGLITLAALGIGAADLETFIRQGFAAERVASGLVAKGLSFRDPEVATFGPPLTHPRKIWGIGLNYRDHASDLDAPWPNAPASFMKGDHVIIGNGQPIQLPRQSARVTAEGELGLIIGRECRDVEPDDAFNFLFGVCALLDQTAEDILQENPRFLTRAKNFPTFLSLGPFVVTLDEVVKHAPLDDILTSTVKNGTVVREASIGSMAFGPAELISFHSKMMPLYPGDIILSGTPGATVIDHGDVAECRVTGVGYVSNPVTRA